MINLRAERSAAKALFAIALCAHALASNQPVAYSHKQHLALGLQCVDCHIYADTGAAATIPQVQKCMLCHAKLATDRPEVKKVMAYAASKREIPWNRVYTFPPEALVKFQHGPHYRAKIGCATCHGDMTQATTADVLVKHNMGTCVTCHRQNKAPEDCAACHQ